MDYPTKENNIKYSKFFNNHDEMYRKLLERYYNKITSQIVIKPDDLLGAAFI